MDEKLSDCYRTPQPDWDLLNHEFNFTIDLAADSKNTKHERFYDREANSLLQDWSKERGWLNPPYSITSLFVKKAYEEMHKGAIVVMLLNPSPASLYWQKYIWAEDSLPWATTTRPGVELRWIKGRIKFEPPPGADLKKQAPRYDSVLVIFDSRKLK